MEDNSNLINIDNVQYYQVKNLDTLQFDLDLADIEMSGDLGGALEREEVADVDVAIHLAAEIGGGA